MDDVMHLFPVEHRIKIITGKFLRQNIKLITIFIVFILLFYWFQYRPSEIRKDCYKLLSREHYDFSNNFKSYESEYKACMLEKGLDY